MSEQSLVPADNQEYPYTLLEEIFGASASGDPAVLEDFQKIQAIAEEITYDSRSGSVSIRVGGREVYIPGPIVQQGTDAFLSYCYTSGLLDQVPASMRRDIVGSLKKLVGR